MSTTAAQTQESTDATRRLPGGVLLVTGKGGVGKTTVAAALAVAGAGSGRRTLLVDVEGRQTSSALFSTRPWDYTEREFRPGLHGIALDPAAAVYEYLELFYGIRRVQWLMERSHAIDFVTAAAPGLRDLLLVGKVYEIESRDPDASGRDARAPYDLIVVDAPPTGRIVPFLRAPDGVTEIVRVGPIKRQAGQIHQMLTDPTRTTAVVVTLLEEMPVTETLQSTRELEAAGITTGAVVANQVEQRRLADDDVQRLLAAGAGRLADRVGALDPGTAALALELAAAHRERLALEDRLRGQLVDELGDRVVELPELPAPRIGTAEIELLSRHFTAELGGPR